MSLHKCKTYGSAIKMSKLIFAALAFNVIAQAHDKNASDIETCKHVSASLGSDVIASP